MLRWALIFLGIAIAAALVGFSGLAGPDTNATKVLFFLCLTVFLVLFILGILTGRTRL